METKTAAVYNAKWHHFGLVPLTSIVRQCLTKLSSLSSPIFRLLTFLYYVYYFTLQLI